MIFVFCFFFAATAAPPPSLSLSLSFLTFLYLPFSSLSSLASLAVCLFFTSNRRRSAMKHPSLSLSLPLSPTHILSLLLLSFLSHFSYFFTSISNQTHTHTFNALSPSNSHSHTHTLTHKRTHPYRTTSSVCWSRSTSQRRSRRGWNSRTLKRE